MLAFSALSGGRVEVRARAKVNLGLEVLGRRADGYHELRSVMWAIELADRVTLEASGDDIAARMCGPRCPADARQSRLARGCARPRGNGSDRRDADPDREAHSGGGGARRGLRGCGRRPRGARATRAPATGAAPAGGLGRDARHGRAVLPGAGPRVGVGPRRAAPAGRGGPDLSLVLANPGFPLATRDVYGRLEPGDFGDGRADRRAGDGAAAPGADAVAGA